MRSYILLAAIFAVANADGHDKKEEWNKDMDMGHHDKDHGDMGRHDYKNMDEMKEIECMMSGVCDSAVTYGATATVFAATLAALI